MVSKATKTTRLIQLFGITKVPMIWYCRPKVIEHTDEKIEIKIPLKRKTKNHLGSMYFGVLAVGADITGGFLAMDPIQESGRKINLIFKDFKADFLKRPEGDVHFTCNDGLAVKELVDRVSKSSDRHNFKLSIEATVPSISSEVVAKFELTLSLKDKT
jgi:acyl-coenzyme A thioesterase PaaI-like protein